MTSYSGSINNLIPHNNNVICDVCGRKRKRSECVLAYGSGDIPVIMSCIDGCADTRHPLNSPPPIVFDGQPVPDARPDLSSNILNSTVTYITAPFNPSYMTWGKFQTGGNWGKLNNGNKPNDNFNTQWTWGNFKRS